MFRLEKNKNKKNILPLTFDVPLQKFSLSLIPFDEIKSRNGGE